MPQMRILSGRGAGQYITVDVDEWLAENATPAKPQPAKQPGQTRVGPVEPGEGA